MSSREGDDDDDDAIRLPATGESNVILLRVVSGYFFILKNITHESVCKFLFYSTVCNIRIFLVSVIDEEDVPGMSVLFWSEIIFAVLCYNVPSVNWSTKLY